MRKVINAKVCVMNCPDDEFETGYLVVRVVDLVYWYYGFYESYERALRAAAEIGNGIVLGVVKKGD